MANGAGLYTCSSPTTAASVARPFRGDLRAPRPNADPHQRGQCREPLLFPPRLERATNPLLPLPSDAP
jgi:hypothetical protein